MTRAGIVVALGLLAIVTSAAPARAQMIVAPDRQLSDKSGVSLDPGTAVSKDPLGKPCIGMGSIARGHVSNPNVYDHVVTAKNHCLKSVKLEVCYYKSDRCYQLAVPGMAQKDLILGIFPGVKYFRYSYKEVH